MGTKLLRHARRHVVAYLALFFGLGAVAYAAIPDSGGVIHGCYDPTAARAGANPLYVIDTSTTSSCPAPMTALNWNQTGPPGPQGPPGEGGNNLLLGYGVVDPDRHNGRPGFVVQDGLASVRRPRRGHYCIRPTRQADELTAVVTQDLRYTRHHQPGLVFVDGGGPHCADNEVEVVTERFVRSNNLRGGNNLNNLRPSNDIGFIGDPTG